MTEISADALTIEEQIHLTAGNSFWSLGGCERLNLPPVKTSDASNGLREQYRDEGYASRLGNKPALCYPSLSACGASFDVEAMFEMGKALGETCAQRGIGVLLGPGINIKRSPLGGRNFEYISEDPVLSGMLGAAFIRGVQSTGTAACPKHLAANSQETRRCKSDSVADDETLFTLYLRSFEIAVKEGRPWTIMAAYNRLNGTYCCENKWLLTDVLREMWGFDGAVLSDWGGVNDMVSSVNAGMDVEMPGGVNKDEAQLLEAYENGSLKKEALRQAAEHVLRLTARVQTEAGADSARKAGPNEGSTEEARAHRDAARRMAESSFVLLQNEQMLPLKKEERLLVIGSFAKAPRYQGAGSGKVKLAYGEPPWLFLKEYFPNIAYEQGFGFTEEQEQNDALCGKALQAAETADKVLIFAGLPESSGSEAADRADLKLPGSQNRLIRALSRRCKNITVILQAGGPVEMLWRNEVQGILLCHLGGSCLGSALLHVLTGEVNPSGRLAESFPERLADTPSYEYYPAKGDLALYREKTQVGYRYYNCHQVPTAFPFGYGLSYTSFSYENLTAKFEEDGILASCEVKNTGGMDGSEAVQLYIAPKERPQERILAAFAKVFLKAGESKNVSLSINPEYIAGYDAKRHALVLKKGAYILGAGADCTRMHLETVLQLETEQSWPITAASGSSRRAENFRYRKEKRITANASLRDLEQYRAARIVTAAVKKAAGKLDTGIISGEAAADMLVDTPFRQLPMGTNGAISMSVIQKACAFLDKVTGKTKRKK